MIVSHKTNIMNLLSKSMYSYYIHLKDHNKKINPKENKLSLSYMNPRRLMENAPQEAEFNFRLKKKTQEQLEKKMFEDYKMKVLKGQIDVEEQVEIDPLWGEQEKPAHFFQNYSKIQLMSVSAPQRAEFMSLLDSMYENQSRTSSATEEKQLPEISAISALATSQLVEVALNAVELGEHDLMFWTAIENTIGNRFYELSNIQLIQLIFCFKQEIPKGSPRTNTILKDLLSSEVAQNLTKDQLKFLHYSLRNSKNWGIRLQESVQKAMDKHYADMQIEQKIDWLFSYTLSSRPKTYKKRQQKHIFDSRTAAHTLLFKLNLGLDFKNKLSVESCVKLTFSLAKLRVVNTKWITGDIIEYLKENVQALENDLDSAYKLLCYLPEVEGGEGVYDEELFQKLIQIVTKSENFEQLSKIQQMRAIYAIWNYDLMSDDIFQLYQNIQMEADSTLMNYFCQIEMSRSSERQWQVLKCLAELDNIPLPYYQSVKRFYNYMSVTTDWDLQPIKDKLYNTEHYFDCIRGTDSFMKVKTYKALEQFRKFSNQPLPFEMSVPIDNLQLCMFANSQYQVTVDVITEAAFIPGTQILKESYKNKKRSLQNLGWKHVYLFENDLQALSSDNQLNNIMFAFEPYMEEQAEVIASRDYYRAEEINRLSVQEEWDLMTAEEAEGYRNDAEGYAKRIAEIEAKQRALSEEIIKNDN